MQMLKEVNLKGFLEDVDRIIAENERLLMGEKEEQTTEPVTEETTVTEEVVATPVVTTETLVESIKTDSKNSNQRWVLLVHQTNEADVLEFTNAVQAAKHFSIHPTTVRTRCTANSVIDGYKWQYLEKNK